MRRPWPVPATKNITITIIVGLRLLSMMRHPVATMVIAHPARMIHVDCSLLRNLVCPIKKMTISACPVMAIALRPATERARYLAEVRYRMR